MALINGESEMVMMRMRMYLGGRWSGSGRKWWVEKKGVWREWKLRNDDGGGEVSEAIIRISIEKEEQDGTEEPKLGRKRVNIKPNSISLVQKPTTFLENSHYV